MSELPSTIALNIASIVTGNRSNIAKAAPAIIKNSPSDWSAINQRGDSSTEYRLNK